MKTTTDMEFDELVDWCAGHILKELIRGNFRQGVWTVVGQAIRWENQQAKQKKKRTP